MDINMKINNIYNYIWITDIYNPNIKEINENLIQALNGIRYKVINSNKTNLYQSIMEIQFIVEEIEGPEMEYGNIKLPIKKTWKEIIRNIGKIMYEPITIGIKLEELNSEIIEGLKTIIKKIVELKTNIKVVDINVFNYFDNIIIFNPKTTNNNDIYINPIIINDIITLCDLYKNIGYQILTDDPLINILINELSENGIRLEIDDIKTINGIMLIKIGKKYNEYKDEINEMIKNKRMNGYFTIPETLYNIPIYNDNYEIYLEIAKMMDMKIYSKYDHNTIGKFDIPLILQTDIDFKERPENWLIESSNYIKNDHLPRFIITGWWQYESPSDILKAKIYYASLLTYSKLIEYNPLLEIAIEYVKILDDYSIEIPISSKDDIIKFNELLMYEMENLEQWTSDISDSLNQAFIKRWYYSSQLYQNSNFNIMILYVNDINILIINSNNNQLFNKQNSYEIYESELLKQLKSIYPELNSIQEYLDIKNDEWGIRGLYDIDFFNGLLFNKPKRYYITPTIGSITIINNDCSSLQTLFYDKLFYNDCDIDNNISSVNILLDDGTLILLFELLNVNDIDLYPIVDNLWKNGWFLNIWATCFMYKFNSISILITSNQNLLSSNSISYYSQTILFILKQISDKL